MADKRAFGASTLRCNQVSILGSVISFNFVGKKGIQIQKTIKDNNLARLINQKCGKNKNKPIFTASDDMVRQYLHSLLEGEKFLIKDFRTHIGTELALKEIKSMPAPKNEREFKNALYE